MFSMSGMMVEAQWMTNCGAWRKASPIEEATLWYLVCWRNMYENNCYSMLFRLSLHKGCWMCGHDCNKCIQGLHVVGTHSEPAWCSISGATLLWPPWLQGCPTGRVKLQASAASMLRLGVFRIPNFPRRDVEITELKVSFQNQRLEVANWTNEAVWHETLT